MKYLENIDVMNKDKSQMILIRISRSFLSSMKQEIFKAHENNAGILSLYAVIWITALVFIIYKKYKRNT
jgi:hypothetical protein